MSILVLLLLSYCISTIVIYAIVAHLERDEPYIEGVVMGIMVFMMVLGPIGMVCMGLIGVMESFSDGTWEFRVRNPFHKK